MEKSVVKSEWDGERNGYEPNVAVGEGKVERWWSCEGMVNE